MRQGRDTLVKAVERSVALQYRARSSAGRTNAEEKREIVWDALPASGQCIAAPKGRVQTPLENIRI